MSRATDEPADDECDICAVAWVRLRVLFDLGFDTAMTIGVVAVAVATPLTGASVWLVLALPLCFASGTTLVDAIDGIAMTKLYSGEGLAPGTKIFFTLITTGVSGVVAAVLGTIILVSTAHEVFALTDPWTAGSRVWI